MARAYGLDLDPWQENVLQACMGERADGQWASPRVGVSVPRQNGKGALIEARELAGLLVFGERTIVHSAHESKTARIGFERIRAYFDNYDDLRKRVRRVIAAVGGRESIELLSGQQLHFPARSKGAIRGFSIDCLLLDEGQILADSAWEAILPTISARPNPQVFLLGTPPTPLDDSAVFDRMRLAGLEGKDGRFCWCEWSAPPGSDLDDREAWTQSNPALGRRITYEQIADERAALSDDGFARERLGMWADPKANAGVFDNAWPALADPAAARGSQVSFGVSVAPDRSWSAVAVAWRRTDGRVQVMLADYRASTEWVAARVAELRSSWGGSVVASTTARGLVAGAVEPSQAEQALAHTGLDDAVRAGSVRHGNEPALNVAVRGAQWRPYGDTRMFDRKGSLDISPLDAAALAVRATCSVDSLPPNIW